MNIESSFSEAIKKLKENEGGVVLYVSELLETTTGQKYKIAIHQLVWYAIKVFVEVDPRLAMKKPDGFGHMK